MGRSVLGREESKYKDPKGANKSGMLRNSKPTVVDTEWVRRKMIDNKSEIMLDLLGHCQSFGFYSEMESHGGFFTENKCD